ncbi:hypothetical protein F5883DRAFT_683943 [Diaporthe sp. PMI_573]|nr:hypothetical protein F5883DRAFT_683943 [Diaporthaceae sp. PMI_573]
MPSENSAAGFDTDVDIDDDPSVVIRQSESELRLLKSGEFSDFTVICGNREWKVHKNILSKVPYFNAAETAEEKITIEEFFQPFEIQWLLAYIYFPYFDPEAARFDTASKSCLETCVRLWQLGDYFQVDGMMRLASEKLKARCDAWRSVSDTVDTAVHGTTFVADVESAVRNAWREDLAPDSLRVLGGLPDSILRERLTKLCRDFAPYLKHQQSFFELLEEVPRFAVTFSQRAMGSITSSLRLPKPDGVTPMKGCGGPAPRKRVGHRVPRHT